MTTGEILDLLNELEARFRVDEWTCDGLHAWPFIRIRLSYDLYYCYRMNFTPEEPGPVSSARRALGLLKDRLRYLSATLKDARMIARPAGTVDALFFSDGVSFAMLDGVWFEKFCDPLIAVLREKGRSSLLISPLHEYRVPRATPSLFVQPRIDLIKARAFLLPGRAAASTTLMEELPVVSELLSARSLPLRQMNLRTIRQYCRTLLDIAAMYSVLLDRLKPTLAFVVSYYGVEGMGAVLACRSRGIPVVDLQHGMQGPLHSAYGRWNRVPFSGYELLPSYFWCWTQSDVDSIAQWSASFDSRHHPLLGGNTWMELWKHGGRLTAHSDAVIQRVMDAFPGAQHVLVTLQPGMTDAGRLAPLLSALRDGGPGWHWWIRLHPGMLGDRAAIRDLVSRHSAGPFTLDLATDLPLYALLRHLHVHVTMSSSTVVECQQFGIPSVILSSFGAEFFAEQINAGWAVTAQTGSELISAMRALLDVQRQPRPVASAAQTTPEEHAQSVIDSVLRHAGRSFSSSRRMAARGDAQ